MVSIYPYSTKEVKYTTVNYNNFSYNKEGIYIVRNTKYANIYNNSFYNNTGYGISIGSSGQYNKIYNNTFILNNGATNTYNSNHVQAADSGTNNYWNTSGSPHGYGNYWADWANNNNTNDQNPPYGIIDWHYKIDGSADAEDYYPLTHSTTVPELSPGSIMIVVIIMSAMLMVRKKL